MKARAKGAIALFAIVAIIAAILLSSRSKGARSVAQQTKVALRKEGFKLEIEDFGAPIPIEPEAPCRS